MIFCALIFYRAAASVPRAALSLRRPLIQNTLGSSFNPGTISSLKPKDRLKFLAGRSPSTRAAPSPTGFMHVGTLRTMWHNYLLACLSGGSFILRVDDTDLSRNQKDSVDMIYQMASHYDIFYDQTFLQSSRF